MTNKKYIFILNIIYSDRLETLYLIGYSEITLLLFYAYYEDSNILVYNVGPLDEKIRRNKKKKDTKCCKTYVLIVGLNKYGNDHSMYGIININ